MIAIGRSGLVLLSSWLLLATALTAGPAASARTVYVDFDGGSDDNDGLSPHAAVKHCPGDAAATGTAKTTTLAPGDTVIFKGGVTYFGEIAITSSGEAGKLITFDGNTAGKFGTGRAIIDGGAPLAGWKHPASAEEVKGNPKWKEIFYTDVPGPADWKNFNLCAADKAVAVAQEPKMSDPFFQETVKEFYEAPGRMASTFPGKVYYEPGTMGNSDSPLFGVIVGEPAVVEPITGGAFTVELNESVTVKTVGIEPQPNYPAVKEVAFLGDGKELLKVTLARDAKEIQKFDLPAPVTVKKLTFKLLSAYEGEKGDWTKIALVGAWTPEGKNVFEAGELLTTITDTKVLTQADPHYYDGMTVGVHGGNNWVSFQEVKKFDPAAHRLCFTYFPEVTYNTSRYSFYNSVRLIGRPGEYSLEPTADKKVWRVFYLPEQVEGDQPALVYYSVRSHGFALTGAAHVALRGFIVRHQGHGSRVSGISAEGGADLTIADCEITLVQGSPALGVSNTDGVVVEKCYIHHCSGPDCRGMVIYKCHNAVTRFCRIVKTTGTAVDYYTCTDGKAQDNLVTDIRGMHSNGLTFYVGNKNIVIERNEVHDSNVAMTIKEAEDFIIRNNILDGSNKCPAVGIWGGGATGMKNVQFLNNTLVRAAQGDDWSAAVFSNNDAAFENVVFRNNIIDGLAADKPNHLVCTFDHNLYTKWGNRQRDHKLGEGELYEPDLKKIFVDPDHDDFHLCAGSPAIKAGVDVGLKEDMAGVKIPAGQAPDIGAYQFKQ